MKKLFILIPITLFVIACGPQQVDNNEMPADLAGKRALLKEKRAALQALQAEINLLEDSIALQDPNSAEKRTLVTTTNVETRDFKHFIDIQGTVQSDDLITVSSETGGRILELKVAEGQSINKGQLIAKLDLEQLKKQIAEVQTSLDLANEVFERQKRLWDQNIGSEIQYLQAKNNKERLEKSLETLNFQLSKSDVYAPISGVVERLISKAGEITGPGTPILQILNTNKIKVVADVPENYLGAVNKGKRVKVNFPALDKELDAPITMIGRTINPGNRTFKIEINLSNPGGQLKPNLLANVQLNDYTNEGAIIVPLELVQQEVGGQSYVFIKADSPDGPIAQKVYVKPGESFEGEIVIKDGLKGDEVLIMEGARSLADKALIEIQNAAG